MTFITSYLDDTRKSKCPQIQGNKDFPTTALVFHTGVCNAGFVFPGGSRSRITPKSRFLFNLDINTTFSVSIDDKPSPMIPVYRFQKGGLFDYDPLGIPKDKVFVEGRGEVGAWIHLLLVATAFDKIKPPSPTLFGLNYWISVSGQTSYNISLFEDLRNVILDSTNGEVDILDYYNGNISNDGLSLILMCLGTFAIAWAIGIDKASVQVDSVVSYLPPTIITRR
jgi:hypothetical protein